MQAAAPLESGLCRTLPNNCRRIVAAGRRAATDFFLPVRLVPTDRRQLLPLLYMLFTACSTASGFESSNDQKAPLLSVSVLPRRSTRHVAWGRTVSKADIEPWRCWWTVPGCRLLWICCQFSGLLRPRREASGGSSGKIKVSWPVKAMVLQVRGIRSPRLRACLMLADLHPVVRTVFPP